MRFRCLVIVVALLVGSCTGTEDGQPLPANSTGSTVQSSPPTGPSAANTPANAGLPANGAPKVASPLNPGPFPQDPCRLVREEQAKQLGVPWPGTQRQGPTGPACEWSNLDTGSRIGLQFEMASNRGLSRVYELRSTYSYFIEIPSIEGVPAVAFGRSGDQEVGACSLWVGITDQLVFLLSGRLSGRNRQQGKDACQAVQTAAGMMLKTMKGEA